MDFKGHDQCGCGKALTLRAAAQLRTCFKCSGTMSSQLEGLLGNSTSVLRILHPNCHLDRNAVRMCMSHHECITEEHWGLTDAAVHMMQ